MPFTLAPDARNRTVGICLEKGWAVSAICKALGCGHVGHLGQVELAALPSGASLDEIAARLKCSACGGSDGLVGTVNGGWAKGWAGVPG
jgi:hypothetical protein